MYNRLFSLLIILLLVIGHVQAQKSVLTGKVTDAVTGETLVGVNVVIDSVTGVATGPDGIYRIELSPGRYDILFKYIGYESLRREVMLPPGQSTVINIRLEPQALELNTAVVSAARFEQKLSDVTVSMDIIKPKYIESTNTTTLETVVNQMPGVEVMDGQTSIRGGSGYSYGTGSRVLFLVDDLPIISPDAGDVKWNFLPIETVAQVEILKGASSALYGSSALDGVINIRTAQPGVNPKTTVNLSGGMYLKPRRRELAWWWESDPLVLNASIAHLRKINNIDLVLGGNAFSDAGYRQDEYFKRVRFNGNFRIHNKKVEGLSYGFNTNVMLQHNSDFFLWIDADSGAFRQPSYLVTPTKGLRMNVDPYIVYYNPHGDRHSLRSRYYRVTNIQPGHSDKNSIADQFYGEYQYHTVFKNRLNWTMGVTGTYASIVSQLYGDHYSTSVAAYSQFDWKYSKRWSFSLGVRWEGYKLGPTTAQSNPVVRSGLNFQAAKYTFLRASFGQGYRFPSIAEKYASTSLGIINIFPNPDLEPETGWSLETGIKQGLKIGQWDGYIDVAGFWTEYGNMVEFTFGIYKPDTVPVPTIKDVGFKSLNVGHARITGVDILLTGKGKIAGLNTTFFAGYTYTNPVNLNPGQEKNTVLKYRFYHSAKGDIQADIGKFSVGMSFIYNSNIINIDTVFEAEILGQELLPGLKEYRQKHDKGIIAFDFRFAFQVTRDSRLTFYIKNAFNEEYMGRPGDIQPPRNIALQYLLTF